MTKQQGDKRFRVLVTRTAFYGGALRAPGTTLSITLVPGAKFPSWAKKLPDSPEEAEAELKAAHAALAAHQKRPALATMSELNRANADLTAAMGETDTKPPTAAQASVAAAAAEKKAAEAADTDSEDLLR